MKAAMVSNLARFAFHVEMHIMYPDVERATGVKIMNYSNSEACAPMSQ